jgi:hypothetical protein
MQSDLAAEKRKVYYYAKKILIHTRSQRGRHPHPTKTKVALLLCVGQGARGAAELVPRGGDLLHESDVRRGQPLVLSEQRVRLLDLGAESLLKRCHQVRLGRQGATVPREMVEMRRWLLPEAVGMSGRQARWLAEVIEVVTRGEARRRLVEVIKVVVGREVGVVERRRWQLVAAAAAREGVGRRVTVATGHEDLPEPYR